MDELDELLLNIVVLEGARRCSNFRRKGTSVIFPGDRGRNWSNQILDHQRTNMKPAEVTALHHELLKRADAFLQFFDSNVGGSEEFPLQLFAESYETLEAFHGQLSRVRSAVGILTEV